MKTVYKTIDVIGNISEGLFSRALDAALWMTIFTAELSLPQSRSGQVFRAEIAANRFVHQWNYETIKQALADARRRRLLAPVKRGRRAPPKITQAGRQRLAAIIPIYDDVRIWDGRMHLVTYDIPEKHRDKRDALREQLRKIGAGKLQNSVWLTPYNPIDLLREFIQKERLGGTVVVSDMGKDGSIGEEDLGSLLVRLWQLDKINDYYAEWLAEAKRSDRLDHWMLVSYLSILKSDPQLPFPLLPKWWKGDQAYRQIKPKLRELELHLRP